MVASHGVEDAQQLAHAGDEGNLRAFAGGDEALVEGPNDRVEACGGEGGHVQHPAQLKAPALDVSPAADAARFMGHGRNARQSGELTAVEPAEFGQVGQEGGSYNFV